MKTEREDPELDGPDVPELDTEHAGRGPEDEAPREEDPGDESLTGLRAERDDYLARWHRARADYQNLRRRSGEELEGRVRLRMQPLLEGVLLVLDNLEMALACPAESDEAKNLAIGVRMTRDQLVTALESEGVERIPTDGTFDPNLHQAMGVVEAEGAAPGSIVHTLRAGFTWRGVVLRSAQVQVTPGEAPAAAPSSDEGGA